MSETIDFIGIGAARSGTTWIAEVLRSHPQICMSEPKEVRYFNRHVLPLAKAKGENNANHDRDLAWYLDRFRHARSGQLKGEVSPIYLYDEAAPAAIRRCFSGTKLIACLRNPADRAYSHYWLHRGSASLGTISFEQALQEEDIYIGMGYYARQLKRYLRYFDRQQLLVLIFEDLVRDPSAEMERLLEFLGVTTKVDFQLSRHAMNAPAKVRFKAIKRAAFSVSRMLVDARLSALVKRLRRTGAHSLVNRVSSTPLRYPPMAGATRRRLVEVFSQDIAELESLLERDLAHWKGPP